jgi:hypothetical protein
MVIFSAVYGTYLAWREAALEAKFRKKYNIKTLDSATQAPAQID